MTAGMEPWLAGYLEGEGIMDASTRLTKRARHRRCPQCNVSVLACLDDVIGGPLYVDRYPVNATGELFAVLTYRKTYTLTAEQLDSRDWNRIAYRSADDEPVYVQHSCAAPKLPVNGRFVKVPLWKEAIDNDADPPF